MKVIEKETRANPKEKLAHHPKKSSKINQVTTTAISYGSKMNSTLRPIIKGAVLAVGLKTLTFTLSREPNTSLLPSFVTWKEKA